MIHASRILHHSRKLRNTYNVKQKDHVSLVSCFTHHARKSVNDIDDVPGLGHGDKHSTPRIPSRGSSSPSPQSINETTKSTVGMVKGSVLWTARNRCSPAIGLVYKRQNSIRYFSTESGLPPHQEIGMPSLSPTMTEGNIARWLKKEGEKLSPGEVLCEVETDKATVEMECMEEGFLAKIVHGDGSTGIKVGEIIAITVEEEEDITKFKDYSPSTSDAAASAPTPPKEVPVAAASSPEPKTKANYSCPHQEIGMPSLSPTMTEGNIAMWLKKQGEKLSPGEVLCEVETDKATVEMECMEEGYLAKIVCGDGSTGIKVGEIIAVTVENEEDVAKFKDYTSSTSDAAAPSEKPSPPTSPKPNVPKPSDSEPSSTGDGSPLTTLLAKDQKNASPSNKSGTSSGEQVVKADGEDHPASHGKEVSPAVDNTDIPQTQIRKVTASRLLMSKQTIPHYYLSVDTCVDKLVEVRSQLNSFQEGSGGKRISINDLVIKAAALALRDVPQCNSSWSEDHIRQFHNVNINVAVQTDHGLCVPVIKNADKKGISTISEEVKYLAQKAKENSLKPADFEGGTFTVSNLGGSFGISQFCAIINPPQAGILAVGSAEKRIIPGSDLLRCELASFMSATLSCDHRVVDGAVGAEWLKAFKGYIENPESMLL